MCFYIYIQCEGMEIGKILNWNGCKIRKKCKLLTVWKLFAKLFCSYYLQSRSRRRLAAWQPLVISLERGIGVDVDVAADVL